MWLSMAWIRAISARNPVFIGSLVDADVENPTASMKTSAPAETLMAVSPASRFEEANVAMRKESTLPGNQEGVRLKHCVIT